MLPVNSTIIDWIQLIRGEYLEIPNLSLTKPEVERLWGLDPTTAEAILDVLIDSKFLRRTSHAAYVRADAG